MLSVTCPSCGTKLKVVEAVAAAGRPLACPRCQQPFVTPTQEMSAVEVPPAPAPPPMPPMPEARSKPRVSRRAMLVAAIGLLALIVGAMGIFLWKLESAGARNLRLGREAVERKDYRFAISILDDAIRQDEKQPELFRLRSRARGGVGDWVGAANDLTEAMRLGDKSDDAYRSRAAVYCILSQPELAIQDYDRLIAAHPNEADLWYSRGQQHREAGNSRNARSDLLKAGELDPDKYGKAADLFAPGQ